MQKSHLPYSYQLLTISSKATYVSWLLARHHWSGSWQVIYLDSSQFSTFVRETIPVVHFLVTNHRETQSFSSTTSFLASFWIFIIIFSLFLRIWCRKGRLRHLLSVPSYSGNAKELLRNVGTELGWILGKSPPFPSSFLTASHLEMANCHITLGVKSS